MLYCGKSILFNHVFVYLIDCGVQISLPPPLFTTLLVIYTYSDVGKLFYNRSLFFITIPQSWAVSIGHSNWFLVEGVEVRSLSLFKCGHWACRSVRYLLYSKLLAIVAYIGVVRSPTSTKTSTSLLARFCKACVALAKFSYSTLFASQHTDYKSARAW